MTGLSLKVLTGFGLGVPYRPHTGWAPQTGVMLCPDLAPPITTPAVTSCPVYKDEGSQR
jgi:hypothetical protein